MVQPRLGPHANLFYPMSPRQTMLLAMIFMRGGQEDLPLLELLPDDDGYLLQEKAEALLQIEGDGRAGVIVREIRRQVQFAGLAGLESIDPSWLLAGVRGEQPITIGIILSQLSATARSRILAQIPSSVRAKIPGKEDLKNTKLEIMRIVRQRFEAKFTTMPAPPSEPTTFYFKDVTLLEARELIQLIRALGIEELASAFLTVGRRKLAELCTKLGSGAAEELIKAVKDTDPEDAMAITDANDFLSKILMDLKLDEARGLPATELKDRFQKELFQKAGLFRLAKAIRMERPAFVQQLAQRIPRGHGKLLKSYTYKLNEKELDEVKLRRLQDLVLMRIEKLAERGKVNPRYLKFSFCYWGDDSGDSEAPAEGEEDYGQYE